MFANYFFPSFLVSDRAEKEIRRRRRLRLMSDVGRFSPLFANEFVFFRGKGFNDASKRWKFQRKRLAFTYDF